MELRLTYQVVFIINFAFSYFLMKMVSWICTPKERQPQLRVFICTPFLSVRSLRYKSISKESSHLVHFLSFGLMTGTTLVLGHECLLPLNYFKTLLLGPTIYFLTEALGALGQLLFSVFKHKSFPIHYRPLFSPNLSQFWGRNWNLWVQDWLKDVAQKFGHGSAIKRILVTFAISGLFHEIMVNLPYWVIYKKSYFGTMMLYFIIQSGALWVDKRYIKKKMSPFIQRVYLWTVVILPSPLFINVPLLTFLGIKNG